mmetsp:Transcript_14777/g.22745  ORF Transcript_14777/g.22745 Transcript_14777/m.22745 type:complete len:89 (-) Transcript_14777:475-741(-)
MSARFLACSDDFLLSIADSAASELDHSDIQPSASLVPEAPFVNDASSTWRYSLALCGAPSVQCLQARGLSSHTEPGLVCPRHLRPFHH